MLGLLVRFRVVVQAPAVSQAASASAAPLKGGGGGGGGDDDDEGGGGGDLYEEAVCVFLSCADVLKNAQGLWLTLRDSLALF